MDFSRTTRLKNCAAGGRAFCGVIPGQRAERKLQLPNGNQRVARDRCGKPSYLGSKSHRENGKGKVANGHTPSKCNLTAPTKSPLSWDSVLRRPTGHKITHHDGSRETNV